jgi:hypothetical protein
MNEQETYKKPLTNYILLKDGTMLEATIAQKEKINAAIMSRTDFQNIQIKLHGRYFKLGDLEDDPKKLANAAQQGLPLGDVEAKVKKSVDMG